MAGVFAGACSCMDYGGWWCVPMAETGHIIWKWKAYLTVWLLLNWRCRVLP